MPVGWIHVFFLYLGKRDGRQYMNALCKKRLWMCNIANNFEHATIYVVQTNNIQIPACRIGNPQSFFQLWIGRALQVVVIKTSKNEVLQMPSTIHVNLGHGVIRYTKGNWK